MNASFSSPIIKFMSFIISFFSFVSGLVSAYYWCRASMVKISPAWDLEIHGDSEKNVMSWLTGNMAAFSKSGRLNKRAAIWTAVTVVLATFANLFSTFHN